MKIQRYASILTLIGLISIIYLTGLYRALHYETIRYQYFELIEFANNNPIMTPFMYMGTVAIACLPFIPGKLLLSLLGGFLFPKAGILYLLIGATLGALMMFLSIKQAAFRWSKPERVFHKNQISYLLFMRLLPFFPFWLGSLIPGLLNVRLRTFIWTTFVGSIPAALILTRAGKDLGKIFESSDHLSVGAILTPGNLILLSSLAIVSLLPIFLKKKK